MKKIIKIETKPLLAIVSFLAIIGGLAYATTIISNTQIYHEGKIDTNGTINSTSNFLLKSRNLTNTYDCVVSQDGTGDFDGTTDVPIRNCVNSIDSTNGGRILIKNGTYVIRNFVAIGGKNNLEICGESRATVLRGAGAPTNIFRQVTNPISNVTFCNMEWDGNNSAAIVAYFQGGNDNIVLDNIYAHNSSGSFVVFFDTVIGNNININLRNSRFAYSFGDWDIVGAGGQSFVVENNVFENDENNTGEGFAIGNGHDVRVINNKFTSYKGTGFAGNAVHTESNSSNIIIQGNYFQMRSGNSIDIGENVSGVIISDNIINSTASRVNAVAGAGRIYLQGTENAVIKNNYIKDTTWDGIRIADGSNIIIEGNVLIDASNSNHGTVFGDGNNYQDGAIQIANLSTQNFKDNSHIVIKNNIIRSIVDSDTAGILVDTNYSFVTIEGNDVSNATNPKILNLAKNTTMINNIGFTNSTIQSNLQMNNYNITNVAIQLNTMSTQPFICNSNSVGFLFFNSSADHTCECRSNGWKNMTGGTCFNTTAGG